MFYCKKKKTLDLDATVLIVHKTSRYEIFSVVFKKTNEELNMRGNDPCSAFLKLSSARKVINSCLRCPNNFSREVTLYHTQLNFCHIKQHEHRVVGCIHI